MRDRSKRGQLQILLGERGTVLPHQKGGTLDRPARGWYAELIDGGAVVFLGDDTLIAAITIGQLS